MKLIHCGSNSHSSNELLKLICDMIHVVNLPVCLIVPRFISVVYCVVVCCLLCSCSNVLYTSAVWLYLRCTLSFSSLCQLLVPLGFTGNFGEPLSGAFTGLVVPLLAPSQQSQSSKCICCLSGRSYKQCWVVTESRVSTIKNKACVMLTISRLWEICWLCCRMLSV